MKSFKQHLVENAPKLLYHGTGIYSAAAIVQDGKMFESIHWGKPGEPHGPRFTRSLKVAQGFVNYSCFWCEGNGAVFVFDYDKLKTKYEVVEYHDKTYGGDSDFGNEEEEVVLTNELPLEPFLVQIIIQKGAFEFAAQEENLEAMQGEGPDPFDGDTDACMQALEKLKHHPKVRFQSWVNDESY